MSNAHGNPIVIEVDSLSGMLLVSEGRPRCEEPLREIREGLDDLGVRLDDEAVR